MHCNVSRREPYVPLNCNRALAWDVNAVSVGAVLVVANPVSFDSPGI